MSEAPTERDAIMLEPGMICEEHLAMANDWDIPLMNVMIATQGNLLESETFFNIAYRIKNGYGPPEGVGWGEDGEEPNVPESERPGVEHINDTMREIEPLCCWICENREEPFPEEDEPPTFIKLLADYASREMAPEEGNDGE